jgi:phosphomevalonate kinase
MSWKLIVLGEYAVLSGAPALVAAVGRYAEVTVATGTDGCRLIAPEAIPNPIRFVCTDQGPNWLDGEPPPLVAACFTPLVRELSACADFELSLCTRHFFDQGDNKGTKLGLGSSAALTVALIRALLQLVGQNDTDERVFDLALEAHTAFQYGLGSGADIATSTLGGVLQYQLADPPRLQSLAWPSGLAVLPVWTGRAASTRDILARLHLWQANNANESSALVDELTGWSREGCRQFSQGQLEDFLLSTSQFCAHLDRLGRSAGLDILSAEHRQLMRLAEDSGVLYKPSGAGDGDFGLALTTDPDALNNFARAALAAGFSTPIAQKEFAARI